jgi:hypothetical protein
MINVHSQIFMIVGAYFECDVAHMISDFVATIKNAVQILTC